MPHLKGFTTVEFSHSNLINYQGPFFDTLLGNKELVFLYLSHVDNWSDQIATQFVTGLSTNKTLKYLDMHDFRLLQHGKQDALAEALQKNEGLETVKIEISRTNKAALTKIGEALKANKTLKTVAFTWSDEAKTFDLTGLLEQVRARPIPLRIKLSSHKDMIVGQGKAENDPDSSGWNTYLK